MRRLADLIQFMPRGSGELGDLDPIQSQLQFDYTKSQLKTIPIFVVDNIIKWVTSSGESDSFQIGDNFEIMMVPPFDEFWIEFNIDPVGIDASPVLQGFHCAVNLLSPSTDNKKWEIEFVRYSCVGKYLAGPIDFTFLRLNAEGFITGSRFGTFLIDKRPLEIYFNFVCKAFHLCFLALHFLSYPKVRTEEVLPPKRLLGNKALKRGERQPVKFKVLDIEPLKVLLRTEGKMDEVGLKQALTNVRGHWRIYTPEKPLFGHFVGKVFIKDHARGSSELGIIKNTYNIKSPSESEN
jgi:hypothetical protein